jgi:hypothetical protein
MTVHDVKAEIEEAHKQQLQLMKLIKDSSPQLSNRKTQRGGLRKKTGGSIFSVAKDISALAAAIVMIFRKNSPVAVDGFINKYASAELKHNIVVAGKDLLNTTKRGGGESEGEGASKGASKSASKGASKGASKSASKSASKTKSEEVEEKDVVQENVYTGEKNEKGEIHGTGKMEYANGDVYEGQWKNNMRNGKGKITFIDKSTYDGIWTKDQITGKGIYTYFNGDVYEGTLEKGIRSGFGKNTFRNGDVYEGYWKKNRREGQGKMFYENGDVFVGNWKKDMRHGEGRLVDKTGKMLEEGEYENDESPFNLTTTYTKTSGIKSEANKFLMTVGTTFEDITKSEGAKKVKEVFEDFKKSLPAVPDMETLGKYTLSLGIIFSAVAKVWNGDSCEAQLTGKSDYIVCKAWNLALTAMSTTLDSTGTIANEALGLAWKLFLPIAATGTAGALFLLLYGTWKYINAPHNDHGKSSKTRRRR